VMKMVGLFLSIYAPFILPVEGPLTSSRYFKF